MIFARLGPPPSLLPLHPCLFNSQFEIRNPNVCLLSSAHCSLRRDIAKQRLVIRECELFIGGPEAHVERRIVYADVLEL
jgi:hypothetical protein